MSRWGVLSYASMQTASDNRFCGRVYEQNEKGHQFNQHYMDKMFPLNDEAGYGLSDQNTFMDSEVSVAESGEVTASQSKIKSQKSQKLPGSPKERVMVRNLTQPLGYSTLLSPTTRATNQRVSQLSRLWQYRNGLSPSA